jgi:hypothetical protein
LSLLAWFLLFFLYAGMFEYVFHRWILHRPWTSLSRPYEIHAFLHHRVFGGDATYHVQRGDDKDLILFEWWQAPLLLAVHAPVIWGVAVATDIAVFWGGMAALAVYYGLYEYLHWCMHNPTGRRIERTRLFRYLDAQHRLHHRIWRANFNVVLPVGDLIFGTYRPGFVAGKAG